MISAAAGVEFTDAGGSHHLGGGSHGALGAEESLVPLVTVGVDARFPARRAVDHRRVRPGRRHFGL